jgi:drug/metabolite transporter (DMT)-like permease
VKWLLVFIIVLCNTVGDLLNAYGMRQHGHVRHFDPSGLRRLFQSLVHNRYVIGGIIAMAIAFFALLSLLSIAELSFAIPVTAASYLFETVLAKVWLKEEVHWQRWLGACLVACGVGLLAFQA